GPLSLKNMMDFGSHKKGFDAYFKDYAFHLVEANRPMNYDNFHTSLREVIAVMTNNRKLMEDVEAYRTGEENYDMCEALKGIQEEGIAIGRELGLEQGLEQGIL